ncbi:E2-like enzyme [Datura stramonium]|uniref:E2-like enzyme n=1 Tax=Datura stramonium TaxID=4076 RepID=A0ABS8UW40_DATST|nr:E2-like enzyme [Datura stramonium]
MGQTKNTKIGRRTKFQLPTSNNLPVLHNFGSRNSDRRELSKWYRRFTNHSKGTVERITSPNTVSAFKEKAFSASIGTSSPAMILSPNALLGLVQLFIDGESGEPSKRKSYLPADDQFLITRNEISDEDDSLPSMGTLEISTRNTFQSISSYFGGEEEEDIPDMGEFDEPVNLIETDPASAESLIYLESLSKVICSKLTGLFKQKEICTAKDGGHVPQVFGLQQPKVWYLSRGRIEGKPIIHRDLNGVPYGKRSPIASMSTWGCHEKIIDVLMSRELNQKLTGIFFLSLGNLWLLPFQQLI